jgi:copper oxidase (laccase) domain-containing protein
VGEEVLAEFADLEGVADGRMLDLRMVTRRKLEAAGVTQIEDVDLCTSCREDLFFSHRRDKGVTGRQGGFAWLT